MKVTSKNVAPLGLLSPLGAGMAELTFADWVGGRRVVRRRSERREREIFDGVGHIGMGRWEDGFP